MNVTSQHKERKGQTEKHLHHSHTFHSHAFGNERRVRERKSVSRIVLRLFGASRSPGGILPPAAVDLPQRTICVFSPQLDITKLLILCDAAIPGLEACEGVMIQLKV